MMDKDRQIADLVAKVSRQARELRFTQDQVAQKNRELDAMHYVWCSGGCDGGVHRWHPGTLTEEIVKLAERNTERLRTWFESHKGRERYAAAPFLSGVPAKEWPAMIRARREERCHAMRYSLEKEQG